MGFVVSWSTVKCIKIYYFLIKSNLSLKFSWLLSVRIPFCMNWHSLHSCVFYGLFHAFQVIMTLSSTGLSAVFPPGHYTCRTVVPMPSLLWGFLTAVLRPTWLKKSYLYAEEKNWMLLVKDPTQDSKDFFVYLGRVNVCFILALLCFSHLVDLWLLTRPRHQETEPYQCGYLFWLCYDPWHCYTKTFSINILHLLAT